MVALLSDIAVCVSTTVIAVAPIATLTCSGSSSNSASSRSTRGRGIRCLTGVVDSAFPLITAHPVITTHVTAIASAAVGRCICSSYSQPSQPTAWRDIHLPTKDMVQQCGRRRCDVERCFLITITLVLDNDWWVEHSSERSCDRRRPGARWRAGAREPRPLRPAEARLFSDGSFSPSAGTTGLRPGPFPPRIRADGSHGLPGSTGVVIVGAKSDGRKIFGLATMNAHFR